MNYFEVPGNPREYVSDSNDEEEKLLKTLLERKEKLSCSPHFPLTSFPHCYIQVLGGWKQSSSSHPAAQGSNLHHQIDCHLQVVSLTSIIQSLLLFLHFTSYNHYGSTSCLCEQCSAPVFLYPDAGCKDTILYKCQFFLNNTQHLKQFQSEYQQGLFWNCSSCF